MAETTQATEDAKAGESTTVSKKPATKRDSVPARTDEPDTTSMGPAPKPAPVPAAAHTPAIHGAPRK